MDESFLKLKGRRVTENNTKKYFGRLSDILVNKDTSEIIGIISKNDSLIYRHRLFYIKDVVGRDELSIYVTGFGERFVKVVPIFTDYKSCGNDIYKRKAVLEDGSVIGKVQNMNFNLEAGILTEFEIGSSLAQDLLNGRIICPTQDSIDFFQGNILLYDEKMGIIKRKKMFSDEVR